MFIENLSITEFGIFQKVEMEFCKDKINIIQGPNGCGKTTILAILYSMLQDNEIMHYRCEDNEATIKLVITDKNNHICLNKCYRNNGSQIIVKSFDEMKKLLSVNRNMIYLVSGEFIGRKYKLDREMINNANKLLDRIGIENKYKADFLDSHSKSYDLMSGGIQTFYRILNILFNTPPNSVLLIDEPFTMLDYDTIGQLMDIMEEMKDIQFIFTSNPRMEVRKSVNQIYIDTPRKSIGRHERVDFDYKRVFNDDAKLFANCLKDKAFVLDERPIIKYELGKEIEEVEKRNVEFKEIKGNNPCNSIIDNAEIYINAFLNSKKSGIGIIKWGITDDGIVKGVELSKKDRDVIDRKISERIGQMKPYVSTESIQITFEEVVCNDEIIKDLYVVEISVESVASNILFSTSKNEIFIKTEGGKRKLNSFEVQQELQRRLSSL